MASTPAGAGLGIKRSYSWRGISRAAAQTARRRSQREWLGRKMRLRVLRRGVRLLPAWARAPSGPAAHSIRSPAPTNSFRSVRARYSGCTTTSCRASILRASDSTYTASARTLRRAPPARPGSPATRRLTRWTGRAASLPCYTTFLFCNNQSRWKTKYHLGIKTRVSAVVFEASDGIRPTD